MKAKAIAYIDALEAFTKASEGGHDGTCPGRGCEKCLQVALQAYDKVMEKIIESLRKQYEDFWHYEVCGERSHRKAIPDCVTESHKAVTEAFKDALKKEKPNEV